MIYYLVHFYPYDIETQKVLEFRFSNVAYLTEPDDADYPSQVWDPVIDGVPYIYDRRVGHGLFGGTITSYGQVRIANDGGYDTLLELEWTKRRVVVYAGPGGPFSAFAVLHDGIIKEHPRATETEIIWRIADADLDIPVQPVTYLGDGTDLEGPEDLAGVVKPLVLGTVSQVVPVRLTELIYQVSVGPVGAISNVRDNDQPYNFMGDRILKDFEAWSSSNRGEYITCIEAGLFRLSAPAFGNVTADAVGVTTLPTQSGGYSPATHAELAEWLYHRAGYSPNTDMVWDVRDADNYSTGLYLTENRSVASVLDSLAISAGLIFGFDRRGQPSILMLEQPAPVADYEIDPFLVESVAISRVDEPAWRVRLAWGLRGDTGIESTTQSDAPPVYDPTQPPRHDKEFGAARIHEPVFGMEPDGSVRWDSDNVGGAPVTGYRLAEVADEMVRDSHLGAVDQDVITSYYATREGAMAAAARLLSLRGVRRRYLQISASLKNAHLITIGMTVRVTWSRFIPGGVANYRVIGIEEYAAEGIVNLLVWG